MIRFFIWLAGIILIIAFAVMIFIPSLISENKITELSKPEIRKSLQQEAISNGLFYFELIASTLYSSAEFLAKIDQIHFKGIERSNEQVLKRLFTVSRQPWIWEVSPLHISNLIMKSPWIEKVETEWSFFPIEITITVNEIEPWLIAEIDSVSWLISKNGKIVIEVSKINDANLQIELSNLPRLSGLVLDKELATIIPSRELQLKHALQLIKNLELAGGMPFEIEQYSLLPGNSLLLVPIDSVSYPSVRIKASTVEEAEEKLYGLRLILKDLELRGEIKSIVDLRFEGQGVVK